MMKSKHMLGPLAAILLYTALAAGMNRKLSESHPADSESHLLVESKCKCLKVTSRIVVTDTPNGGQQEHLVRDIKIVVPMRSRENISDPTSPLRTKFVYKISDFCKNCTQKATSSLEPQCKPQPPPEDTCYAYDNRKCLYHKINLGDGKQVDTLLNPECLNHKNDLWFPKPTLSPVETTYDSASMSDAP
ncbi:immunoglobulin J chain-like [Heptranchias perlo]|uniref:immunoglobulin J chain-like n=1 Tax=Heptranchias perlo TaxID=212740 RepID=UPI0035597AD5